MQIYYGFTISEFVGLVVGGITLVVLLVYYGISAIIRAWKSRRTKRAFDGATAPVDGVCKHGAILCTICHLGKSPRK